MSGQKYQKAIDILTSQGKFHISLGLERCQAILKIIGNPEKKLQFIHVAGTNGKGSVCSMLSAILTQSGLKVGLFTSPHVFEYTERIKINDIQIEKDIFAENIIKITTRSDENDIHLTEFEIITVAAFDYFAQNKVDIVILETGLGGRLDATNVIEKNICSIITHIDFDHTERLGDTIEKISYEKAGIIKETCPVIINEKNVGLESIKQTANKKDSKIYLAKKAPNYIGESLALKGTYQQENLALVLTAIEILQNKWPNITKDSIKQGLKNVKHPCRFEYLKDQNILIDGAHNPNGTKVLRDSLNLYFPNQKIKFVFGCLNNKNYFKMMENLFNPEDEIYFYQFNNKNACTTEELANACKVSSKSFSEYKKEDNALTVICGSFYMIKELLIKMGIK